MRGHGDGGFDLVANGRLGVPKADDRSQQHDDERRYKNFDVDLVS
jgi:hypothetical protein